MAKNKNRDRKQPQSERIPQSAPQATLEPQDETRSPQVTPGDIGPGKGRGKRFGHN
ncbi:hypothetical protein NFX46_31100 [Streptomyces phaeoluteigriseus]|uniref:Uncharacterized protein n=1 Tax=Streptomyces phaeoluteigriseus TaxID=114686 RepID=A0ABY4ZFS0_9ACTN|nr:hypothetical protein [Streptomyces phaeoluteigriseus]USQ87781.1 hypothetical protein NFX46_31100 [Streptomyces phaeoluteigriseus]